MTKSEIRQLMKTKREELSPMVKMEYDKKIHEKLADFSGFIDSTILFTYISFGSEIDTISIIDKAFQMNKKVYIPRVEGSNMNFYEIKSLQGLISSKFGILEPIAKSDFLYQSSKHHKEKMLMLLPGLAFDKLGNRIGYGAGYYDRYLTSHGEKDWIKVALSYDFQIMDSLPVMGYDISADYIITPNKLIRCK